MGYYITSPLLCYIFLFFDQIQCSIGWIVLAGDSACGKPFYLGSTLNGHFHDAVTLCAAPWTSWVTSCSGAPFKRYAERIQRRTEGVGFRTDKPSGKASA